MPRSTQITWPDGGLSDAHVHPRARIAAAKTSYRKVFGVEIFPELSEVVNEETLWMVLPAAATFVALEAIVTTVATGADRVVTVTIGLSQAGGAFAPIVGSPPTFDISSTTRVPESSATFSPTTANAGDIIRVDSIVSGVAGAQAKGLHAALTLNLAGR